MLRFDVVLLRFVYLYVLSRPVSAVKITNTNYDGIQTGSPYNVTWTEADGPVTLILRMGNSSDFNTLKAMAIWVSLKDGYYVWTPMPVLKSGPYRFELADSIVTPDWSDQFQLTSIAGFETSSPTTAPSSSSTPLGTTTVTVTATPTPSSSTLQTTTGTSSIPTSSSSNTPQSDPQSTVLSKHRPAIIAGIVLALSFLIILTTFFAVHLCRSRRRNLQKTPISQTHHVNNPHLGLDGGGGLIPMAETRSRPKDIETGPVEMSGALEGESNMGSNMSISSPGVSVRTRGGDTSTLSTWGTGAGTVDISQPSTHRSVQTNPELDQMAMVMFPVIMSMEPVEIGSSGYGHSMSKRDKENATEIGTSGYGVKMSEGEKEKAHELGSDEKVKFEEKKSRRKGVKVRLKRLKMFL